MMPDLIFYLALALMLTHQMDAIRCHEWRMIPPLSGMADKKAEQLFIFTHLPMLLMIFWFLTQQNEALTRNFQLAFDIIFTGHIAKHYFLRTHEKNEFNGTLSKAVILLISPLGLLHLLILLEVIVI